MSNDDTQDKGKAGRRYLDVNSVSFLQTIDSPKDGMSTNAFSTDRGYAFFESGQFIGIEHVESGRAHLTHVSNVRTMRLRTMKQPTKK